MVIGRFRPSPSPVVLVQSADTTYSLPGSEAGVPLLAPRSRRDGTPGDRHDQREQRVGRSKV